ncbi:MAG TPA: tetratricopeptide repeat protein [Candidatus Kryptonia bacterium]
MKIWISILMLLSGLPLYSQSKTFVRSYTYLAGIGDNKMSSGTLALYNVKRALLQEISLYLQNTSADGSTEKASAFSRLDSGQICSILGGVTNTKIVNEHWNGKKYLIEASVSVNRTEVTKSISTIVNDRDKMKDLVITGWRADSAATLMDTLRELIAGEKDVSKRKEELAHYASAARILSASLWFEEGYGADVMKKRDKRILFFEKAIELDPEYSEAYHNLGLSYYSNGDTGKAISLFQKAIALNPGYSRAYDDLGFAYVGEDSIDKAIPMFNRAIELDANDSYGYDDLGYAYYKKGDLEKAIEFHETAIRIDPNDSYGYAALGHYYAVTDSVDKAIPLLQKAIELDPNNAFAYDNLGFVYADLDSVDKAIFLYKKAIGISPQHPRAFYNLGNAFSKKGNTDTAIVMYMKAIKLDPKFSSAYYNLGLAYDKKGETRKGADCLKKAALLGNKDAQSWLEQNGYAK